jgi:tetraacyldisaccharide 4'-kinase
MQDQLAWQRRYGWLLAPPGAAWGLVMRLRAALGRMGLPPGWQCPAICLGVSGMAPGDCGQMLVSAWLLGWAEAKGLTTALIANPGTVKPPHMPFTVEPSAQVGQASPSPLLLARYRPKTLVLVDANPVRAGKAAWKDRHPDLIILYNHFSSLGLSNRSDLVLFTAEDLDHGWNRPFPAGLWRESAQALNRAKAFVLHMTPQDWQRHKNLAERRLARFGKPVFTVSPRIWRLRRIPDGLTAQDLGAEPYILVSTDSQQDMTAKAAQAFLKAPARFTVIFPDNYRPTRQDASGLAEEAKRFKCPHILASPQLSLFLPSFSGQNLWSFDPEVVFGPGLDPGLGFASWWDGQWSAQPGGQ